MKETIPIRPGEELDLAAVAAYLRQHLPGLPGGPLQVEQFPAGASNLTYLLRLGAWEGVLRRPPLGPVAPRAHDMEREQRVLALLHPVFPLAPRPLLFCADPAVTGAPFYVMERRHGVVVDRAWPQGWPADPDLRRRISAAVVDVLAALHAVDWQAAGLGEIGRPEGYLERQVNGWISRWERAQTDPVPGVAALCPWLVTRRPPSPPATVVHNDYKLNNIMLDPAAPDQVVAVLDWEMATVGDPLADVAGLLAYWSEPADAAILGPAYVSATALPGFLRRRELLEQYAGRSGRDVSAMGWYIAFAYFKIAVICQQIYYRWRQCQTRDERFGAFGQLAAAMIQRAVRVAETGSF